MKVISDLVDLMNNILFKYKELVDKVYFDDLMIKGYFKVYEKLVYNIYDIILFICIDMNLIILIY